jgi:C4-dicarboxylate transporter DctQ subunit
MKFLDRLEEWLIAFLMGAATLLIFVAVVHRYAAGMPIPYLQDALLKIDLTWAQELCIYMFVWMAKFGAAYGVRTGIHVGVDVMINRLPGNTRKGLRVVRADGGRRLHGDRRHARGDLRLGHRSHRLGVSRPRAAEVDRVPVHPARLYLMCFRFLQVAWAFARTGELPHHDVAPRRGHRGIEDINPYGCRQPPSGRCRRGGANEHALPSPATRPRWPALIPPVLIGFRWCSSSPAFRSPTRGSSSRCSSV